MQNFLSKEAKIILNNNNIDSIIVAIKSLINKPSQKSYNLIIEVYVNLENIEYEKHVFELLTQVNDVKFIKPLISLLNIDLPDEKKARVVSLFWQSKLNFIDYLDDFVLLMNSKSQLILIESFTVIEELINKNIVSESKLNDIIKQIKSYITGKEKIVKLLLTDLVNVVSERL